MSAGARLLASLRNPVFSRELLTLLRRPQGFLLLGLGLTLPLVLILTAWPANSEGVGGQGQLSRDLFRLFGLAQMLVLAFVIPGTLGASMSTEKEAETLDLLLTTPLRSHAIVLGKLLSGLGFLFLVEFAALPVLMLCFVIGGLGAADVVGLYVTLLVQGLVYGLTSLACSARLHSTSRAVMLSYLLVAAEAVLLITLYGDGLRILSSPRGWSLAAAALGVGALALAIAWREVRRPHDPPRRAPEPKRAIGLVLQPGSFPDSLLLPAEHRDLLPDGTDPIRAKELRGGFAGAGAGFVRILIQLGMVLGLVAFLWSLLRSIDASNRSLTIAPGYVFLCFVVGYAMTLGPAVGARAFSGEREQGTADLLVLVLLSRASMVWSKFRVNLQLVVTLSLLNCVPFVALVFSLSFWDGLLRLWTLGGLLLASCALSTAVSLLFSLLSPTTIAAMFRTYLLLFLLWVGPALLPLVWKVPWELDVLLRLISPFRAAVISSAKVTLPVGELACLGLHVLLSLGATALLLRACTQRFDERMNRGASI